MDAMEATQQRVTQLLADARQQIHSLESRLAHETARADQAALRLERAEQVAARAEQLEARLSAFAEQLSSQMDQVQSRVAEMMKFASPLDDARNRLEGAIRQADSTRSKIDESVERGMARMTRQM
jgi:chromosome segregation ATPase